MLGRVLEPEVMDTASEAVDYDSMDHTEVNRRFASDFLAAWRSAERPMGEILDLGTGTAQIPIELCRQDSRVRMRAIDLARHMLELGRQNVLRASFADRIRLERVDAKRLPYSERQFAGVISNSIVHHLPEPAIALAEAMRVTASGGLIFVRDLLRPPDENTLRSLVEAYAGSATEHQRAMFAASLHAALTLDEIRALVEQLGDLPASVQATSDRHWTWMTTT